MFGMRETFTYCSCADCGSLWLADPPDDLSRYYGAQYYSMENRIDPTPTLIHRMAFGGSASLPAALVDWICLRADLRPGFAQYLAGLRVGRHDRIADVGSGQGALLGRMARAGFKDLTGIDPFISESAAAGPIQFHKGTLEDLDADFDLIMFNHSLEHMADPRRELELARQRLRPAGALMVRLPVVGAAWERYGPNWVGLDPPRHMFIPTVDGFQRMAGAAGLAVTRTFFDSKPLQFLGSERYRRDIPLIGSVPDEVRQRERGEMRMWRRRSRKLNRARRGDTAGFHLSKA
jgi:SAM-dependent methyltransferase